MKKTGLAFGGSKAIGVPNIAIYVLLILALVGAISLLRQIENAQAL